MISWSLMTLVTGLAVGLAIGFVMQRGRFCMNTAFRDVIFIQDVTLFRTYILALIIAMVGSNFLSSMHWLGGDSYGPFALSASRQVFAPIANIVGGYIFGIGIVLASGCGSGILFRVGEGLTQALVAVMGFGLSIMTTEYGILKPVYKLLRSYTVMMHAPDGTLITGIGLPDLFGGGQLAKWIIIAVFTIVGGIFVLKGKPFSKSTGTGYYWSFTGLLLGITVIGSFWAGGVYGGWPRGISFTGPLAETFRAVLFKNSHSSFPMFDFFGIHATWSVFYVLMVPVGAFISSKALREFKISVPTAQELVVVFIGSLLMGFGAATAGG